MRRSVEHAESLKAGRVCDRSVDPPGVAARTEKGAGTIGRSALPTDLTDDPEKKQTELIMGTKARPPIAALLAAPRRSGRRADQGLRRDRQGPASWRKPES